MFINKLNQLYKPRRILYYVDVSEAGIEAYRAGKLPEALQACSGAFGTYDVPGVYRVKSLGRDVLGVEYRENDARIKYPDGLEKVVLEAAFFYSIEIDNEIEMDWKSVKEVFEHIAEDDDAHRVYTDLSIRKDPEVVAWFTDNTKIRIIHEWNLDNDHAGKVIRDDSDSFAKDYLYKKAFTDPITGHYNWNHLVSYLEMPMDYGITDYAFVHFDIKDFRVINEVYGHIAANRVLCNVVKAMNEADFVYASARCHDDNFAMMIKDMPEEETIARLSEMFESISRLDVDPTYNIYYRCGVVMMPRSLLSANRAADAGKMAQALGQSHNKTDIIIYTDRMHNDLSWGNFIKAYLETAIENDEFAVYMQPKYNIQRNELAGAEALIRWNYKSRDFLSPKSFVPFFEKDGSIGRIDDIVLVHVCHALAKWKEKGLKLYPVSCNLSRDRLYDDNLIPHLCSIVDSYGVDHSLIDFELTESASYDNTEHLVSVLAELRSLGFKTSMDDFGTGYSSLSLLTQMPLDTLKIDKSFVDHLGGESERRADVLVIKHIITLAGELGFECLAEGAERAEQVDRLRELGCDIVQGYYYSRPIPVDEFEKYIGG